MPVKAPTSAAISVKVARGFAIAFGVLGLIVGSLALASTGLANHSNNSLETNSFGHVHSFE